MSAADLAAIAASAVRGDVTLIVTDPKDGTRYSFSIAPDLFAAPRAGVRLTFIMRRADGEPMPGSWGSMRDRVERDIYGADDLARQLAGTLDAGGSVEAGPYFGPWQPTLSDRIAVWDRHADAFRDAYKSAWDARDWPAVRKACAEFRSGLPAWWTDAYGSEDLHDSAATIARNMRGEKHPPRFHIRYRHGQVRKGFTAHAEAERTVLNGLKALRDLPGYSEADTRQVVPVVLRWTGQVRHVPRAELYRPGVRFLHPVKPDGSAMPRAQSFMWQDVEAIKPARAKVAA